MKIKTTLFLLVAEIFSALGRLIEWAKEYSHECRIARYKLKFNKGGGGGVEVSIPSKNTVLLEWENQFKENPSISAKDRNEILEITKLFRGVLKPEVFDVQVIKLNSILQKYKLYQSEGTIGFLAERRKQAEEDNKAK